jgi:hypothetical protein
LYDFYVLDANHLREPMSKGKTLHRKNGKKRGKKKKECRPDDLLEMILSWQRPPRDPGEECDEVE